MIPIVWVQDMGACGRYLTKELILGYLAAFAAGDAVSRVEPKAEAGDPAQMRASRVKIKLAAWRSV